MLLVVRRYIIFIVGLTSIVYSQTLQDSLVAYYPFDGNANDQSGNGNNGTVLSATLTSDRFGNPNSAYRLDGIDDYIDCGNSTSFDMTTSLTLCVWVYKEGQTGTWQTVLAKSSGNMNGYALFVDNEAFFDSVEIWIANGVRKMATLPDGWHFIVGTFDGSISSEQQVQLYVDGVSTGTYRTFLVRDSIETNTLPFRIGSVSSTPGQYFQGLVDDVRIYNRILNSSEIQVLYQENGWPDNTGLLAYYPLNGNGNDSSGNNIHGNLSMTVGSFVEDRFGNANHAVYFDPVDGLDLGDHFDPEDHDWSVNCWVRNPAANCTLFYKDAVILRLNYETQNHHFLEIGVDETITWDYDLNDGGWHQITCIRNASAGNLMIYIDGMMINERDVTISYIGSSNDFYFGNGTYQGYLDDIRIYHMALDSVKINELYHEGGWPLEEVLVAYYPFNGNANDESGFNNHGTVYGASLVTDRFGNLNSAYSFEGTDDYIDCGWNEVFNLRDSLSISAWIKTDTLHFGTIVAARGGTNNYQYGVALYDSVVGFDRFDPPNGMVKSQVVVNDNQWHHIVVSMNDVLDSVYVFVDGNLERIYYDEEYTGDPATKLYIGWENYYSGPQPFNGIIDDVRIYGQILNEDKVQNLYSENGWPFQSGLVSYYPFNGNANDESGYENHGIINRLNLTEDRFGNLNSAYSFADSGYIEVPYNASSLDFSSSSISVIAWINLTDVTGERVIFEHLDREANLQPGEPGPGISVRINPSGHVNAYYGDGYVHHDITSTIALDDEFWHQIAIIYDLETYLSIYIDGVLNNYYDIAHMDGYELINNSLYIGCDDSLNHRFLGRIDDVRLFNRALTGSEVQNYFDEGGWTSQTSYITVTSPNGGEEWLNGSTYEITWEDNLDHLVDIYLYKSGVNYGPISGATPSDGSYIWNIPTDLPYSGQYKIRVADSLGLYDESDSSFTIKDPNGLWAYYPFDGDATDISSNEINGVVYGANPDINRFGESDGSMYFDGLNDYIDLGNNFDPSDRDFVLNFWLKTSQTSRFAFHKTEQFGLTNGLYIIFNHYSDFHAFRAGSDTLGWSFSLSDNRWHMLTFVRSVTEQNLKIYVDGNLIRQSEVYFGTDIMNSFPLMLGREISNAGFFNGWLDELRIYYKDLSQVDIQLLYHQQGWPFDEDNITVITPNGGEVWNRGNTYKIEWIDNISENVKIDLYNSGGYSQEIVPSIPSDSSYFWFIPAALPTSSEYKIRISRVDSTALYDESDNYFSIVEMDTSNPPPPELLSASPSVWSPTNQFNISWNNPAGYSQIAGAYYKIGSNPTDKDDGTFVSGNINTINGLNCPAAGQYSVFVWLRDVNGNYTHQNRAMTTLYYDPDNPFITHTPVQSVLVNAAININADASDVVSGIDVLQLIYRKTGEVGNEMTLEFSGSDVIIPSTDNTLRGLEYYLKATDRAGNQARDPQNGYHSIQAELEDSDVIQPFAQHRGSTIRDYRIFSIPVLLDDRKPSSIFEDDLGSYDQTIWKLFDVSNNTLRGYPSIRDLSVVTPGKAFLLIIDKDQAVSIDGGSGISSKVSDFSQIQLTAGWNLIGNPFDFDIPLDSLKISGMTPEAWYYDSDGWTNAVDYLRRWEGLAIYAETSEILDIGVGSGNVTKFSIADRFDQENWGFRFNVCGEESQDKDNYLGVYSAKTTGERNRWHEPPRLDGMISFKIKEQGENYSCLLKKAEEKGNLWDIEISSNASDEEVQIGITGYGALPEEFSAQLVDLDLKIAYDLLMSKGPIEVYLGKENARNFSFIAGDDEFITENLLELGVIPDYYDLSQNFPNPFNPMTNIIFELPQESTVSLIVYNILGQKVCQLINNRKYQAGRHLVGWQGVDQAGKAVASGIYIIYFKAGIFTKTRKAVLVR